MSTTHSNHTLRDLPKGNRAPRKYKGRSRSKTTKEVLDAIRGAFLIWDSVSETYMRRVITAIDRQRYRAFRKQLVCMGAVVVDGSPLTWKPTDKLYHDTTLEGLLYVDLDFRPLKSNTHPGQFQIECPKCGVLKRAFPTQYLAKEWFYRDHVVNGVGHA